MATSQTLEFILKARDEASKKLGNFKKVTDKNKKSVDDLNKSMNKLGKTSKKAGDSITSGFVKGTAIIEAVKASFQGLVSVISDASAFEQARISFEVMLGSAKKARETLSELTDFAASTPFELTGVVESSKQLLAYGTESENLVETLKFLGDASAGNQEVFKRLTLAFGQVRAATRS